MRESHLPNRQYILALDQGTTSSRAMVVDEAGEVVSIAQRPFTTDISRARMGGALAYGDMGFAERRGDGSSGCG